MIHIAASGTLFRDHTPQTSKAGKAYAAALIRTGKGDATLFINVRAFGNNASELLRLMQGDVISIQGKADIGVYEAKDGAYKPPISVMASALMPLRWPARQERKPAAAVDTRPRQERLARTWTSERDGPNDDIGFGGNA